MMLVLLILISLITGPCPHPRLRRADPNSVLPPGGTYFLVKRLESSCRLMYIRWCPLQMRRDPLRVLEIHGNEDLLRQHRCAPEVGFTPVAHGCEEIFIFNDFKSFQEISMHLQEIPIDFQEIPRGFNAFQEKSSSSRRQNRI